ncbi:hypothetical protein HZ994_08445 [Akkermansiaceae bacterium]|nr:hypothetical protein HZ994_08445 [Akkermansiaceae bacterium]
MTATSFTQTRLKTIALLATLLLQSALAATPSEALGAFKKAAQTKDFEGTWEHAAKFEGLPEEATEYFRSKVRRFIDLAGDGWDFEIIEEKIEGECAVVVINESKKDGNKAFDLDPAFLIKQDGKWRVLPEVTEWRIVRKVDEDKVDSLEKLSAWFETRKEEIKRKG